MIDRRLVQPPQEVAQRLFVEVMDNLATWRIRSVEAFRNLVLSGHGGFILNPLLDFGGDDTIAPEILDCVRRAVRDGRMIDFGYLPNDVLKLESTRAREAFEARELMMPYDQWVATSSWEGGFNAYFIDRAPDNERGLVTITEIYALSIPYRPGMVSEHDSMLVYDTCGIMWPLNGSEQTGVRVIVVPLQEEAEEFAGSQRDHIARGANMLDPLVTFLRLLADASIPVMKVIASPNLNKARQKAGKHTLPPFHRVDGRAYVTSLVTHPTSRHASPGTGHHSSPIAHWRRAHLRRLGNKVVKVRSAKINWRTETDFQRLFYRVL